MASNNNNNLEAINSAKYGTGLLEGNRLTVRNDGVQVVDFMVPDDMPCTPMGRAVPLDTIKIGQDTELYMSSKLMLVGMEGPNFVLSKFSHGFNKDTGTLFSIPKYMIGDEENVINPTTTTKIVVKPGEDFNMKILVANPKKYVEIEFVWQKHVQETLYVDEEIEEAKETLYVDEEIEAPEQSQEEKERELREAEDAADWLAGRPARKQARKEAKQAKKAEAEELAAKEELAETNRINAENRAKAERRFERDEAKKAQAAKEAEEAEKAKEAEKLKRKADKPTGQRKRVRQASSSEEESSPEEEEVVDTVDGKEGHKDKEEDDKDEEIDQPLLFNTIYADITTQNICYKNKVLPRDHGLNPKGYTTEMSVFFALNSKVQNVIKKHVANLNKYTTAPKTAKNKIMSDLQAAFVETKLMTDNMRSAVREYKAKHDAPFRRERKAAAKLKKAAKKAAAAKK